MAISTTSNSAPHADSRRMVFDAAGNILEADDGGFYRRTSPRATGDWFSLNGSLQVTEMHNVAYDHVSNQIISGNQDTGTSEQRTVGGLSWTQVTQGDGGDVAVDDLSSAIQSTRYSSFQNLGTFRRRTVNAAGVTTATLNPALTLTGGAAFVPQFTTPVELNSVDPARVLFAGKNDLYESPDRGDTIAGLGMNETVAAMVFGGVSGGVNNANLIYAVTGTGNFFARTAGAGAPVMAAGPGNPLRDVTLDHADWNNAYVVNNIGQVFSTTAAGPPWTNLTGNLGGGTNDLRTIVFVPGTTDRLVVGGANGVFGMALNNVGVWERLGTGLSNAPVFDMEYDATDNMLVAGTLGRGAWTLTPPGGGGGGGGGAPFTDPLLVAESTPIRAVHFNEIRGRIDVQLVRFGQLARMYSNAITAGETIKAVDLLEMYTAVNDALAAAGQSAITEPTITPELTVATVSHINNLRAAVLTLEAL